MNSTRIAAAISNLRWNSPKSSSGQELVVFSRTKLSSTCKLNKPRIHSHLEHGTGTLSCTIVDVASAHLSTATKLS